MGRSRFDSIPAYHPATSATGNSRQCSERDPRTRTRSVMSNAYTTMLPSTEAGATSATAHRVPSAAKTLPTRRCRPPDPQHPERHP
eukprot:6306444-Prymnesium_polylepis.1